MTSNPETVADRTSRAGECLHKQQVLLEALSAALAVLEDHEIDAEIVKKLEAGVAAFDRIIVRLGVVPYCPEPDD